MNSIVFLVWTLVLVVSTQAAPLSSGSSDVDCSDPVNQVTLHVNTRNCSTYLQCVHGSLLERPCAPGTVFGPAYGVCVHPYQSDCVEVPDDEPVVPDDDDEEPTVPDDDDDDEEPTVPDDEDDDDEPDVPEVTTTAAPEEDNDGEVVETTTSAPEEDDDEEIVDTTTAAPEEDDDEETVETTTSAPSEDDEEDDVVTTSAPEIDVETTAAPEEEIESTSVAPELETTPQEEEQEEEREEREDEREEEAEEEREEEEESEEESEEEAEEERASPESPEDSDDDEIGNLMEPRLICLKKKSMPLFLYKYQQNCSKYILCTYGKSWVLNCGAREYFNPTSKLCERNLGQCK